MRHLFLGVAQLERLWYSGKSNPSPLCLCFIPIRCSDRTLSRWSPTPPNPPSAKGTPSLLDRKHGSALSGACVRFLITSTTIRLIAVAKAHQFSRVKILNLEIRKGDCWHLILLLWIRAQLTCSMSKQNTASRVSMNHRIGMYSGLEYGVCRSNLPSSHALLQHKIAIISRCSYAIDYRQTSQLDVIPGHIHAIISATQPLVDRSTAFDLDASESWDADMLDNALHFQWTCQQAGSGQSCGARISQLISDAPVLHVPANSLEVDVSYNFSVQVTSLIYLEHDCYPKREDTAWVLVQAKSILPAEARIDVCSTPQCEAPFYPSGGVIVVSPDQTHAQPVFLRLTSSCTGQQSVQWDTTLPDDSKIATKQLLEPHALTVPSETLKYVPIADIVDAQYTFTVAIQCDAEGVLPFSQTSVEVRINSPPFGGRLLVEPNLGEALTTKFTISHSLEWTDDQLPLLYSYSVATSPTSEESVENDFFLTEFPIPRSSLSTFLPVSGYCQDNNELTVIVEVTDHLGSSSRCGTGRNYPCATARVFPYGGKIQAFVAGLKEQTEAVASGMSSSADLAKIVLAIHTSRRRTCLSCGPGGEFSPDENACVCDLDHTGPECNEEESFVWEEWSQWSECDSGCGTGERQRKRDCVALHHKTAVSNSKCQGDSMGVKICNAVPCSSEWSVWGDCNALCEKDVPGVVWGQRRRHRTCLAASSSDCESAEDREFCSITCSVSCPGDCSGHGKCVIEPRDCIDPSVCSLVCDCHKDFSGPNCSVPKRQRQHEKAQNSILLDAIWTSLEASAGVCPVLRNAISMITDIIHGDLEAIATDDLLGLLERISITFLSSPVCLEAIEHDVTEVLGLVPTYINSERLHLHKHKPERRIRPRRGGRRLQESFDADNAKLTQMAELLRDSLQQLTLNKLNVSVPGEDPTEITSGDVLRLTSTNNVGSLTSVCTHDKTSCVTYPPNSLRCPDAQQQFGLALVGEYVFFQDVPKFSRTYCKHAPNAPLINPCTAFRCDTKAASTWSTKACSRARLGSPPHLCTALPYPGLVN